MNSLGVYLILSVTTDAFSSPPLLLLSPSSSSFRLSPASHPSIPKTQAGPRISLLISLSPRYAPALRRPSRACVQCTTA